jgi:protein-S-isoprenylcysteine O-methyltransferase Ste14
MEHLVKKGVYSKLRHPMYIGIMLMHIGFPIASRSLLTLVSSVIWVSIILSWRYMEEKSLERKFGEKYVEYRKSTLF